MSVRSIGKPRGSAACSSVITKQLSKKELEALYNQKIRLSRLTIEQGRKLGYKVCTAAECPVNLPQVAGGFVIPYYDLSGKPTQFIRYRYLEQPARSGFAAMAAARKELRYGQQRSTVNEIYLPPITKWKDVANAPTPIAITEGELKAACACAHTHVPTIGLGGVWCWKSNRARAPMLDQFDSFVWEGRPVYIVFDSDAATNPMVIQAENALATALTGRGAIPVVVRLPVAEDGSKVGLDDYLYSHTVDEYDQLLAQSQEWEIAKELHKLNEEVIYVQDPGFVVRLSTMQKMAPHNFVAHHYSTRTFYQEVTVPAPKALPGKPQKEPSIKLVEKSAPKEWLKWPPRAEVSKITYAPGEERIHKGQLNTWPGWAVEPEPGDIAPWVRLLDYLFTGRPMEREWFERWLAWPLQHPGDKMFTYVLMWSRLHGTGKSLIGYTMKQIYGKNWVEIKNKDIEGTHNGWAENRQFCMGDEIAIGDKRGLGDRVKGMITQEEATINIKFIPTYEVPDVLNYYFTSNHPDSFFLEDNDRRGFIHEVVGAPLPFEFYQEYERWFKRDKYPNAPGPSALFNHLLNLPMGDWNPKAKAPETAAKRDMTAMGRSELGDWVSKLRENPDEVLLVGAQVQPHVLYTCDMLKAMFDPDEKTRISTVGIGRELARQGFRRAADGRPCRTNDGQKRLWVIRELAPADEDVLELQAAAAKYYDTERTSKAAKRSKVK